MQYYLPGRGKFQFFQSNDPDPFPSIDSRFSHGRDTRAFLRMISLRHPRKIGHVHLSNFQHIGQTLARSLSVCRKYDIWLMLHFSVNYATGDKLDQVILSMIGGAVERTYMPERGALGVRIARSAERWVARSAGALVQKWVERGALVEKRAGARSADDPWMDPSTGCSTRCL